MRTINDRELQFLIEAVLREHPLGRTFYKRNNALSQQRRSAYVCDAPADIKRKDGMVLTYITIVAHSVFGCRVLWEAKRLDGGGE
jgi:hypothetical protein